MEEVINLAKLGKPLMTMLMIKAYVQEKLQGKKLSEMDKVCRDLISAILATPSINDESWKFFVPYPNVEEIEALVEILKECLN